MQYQRPSLEELTQKERDVVDCLVCGLNDGEIAHRLGVRRQTIKNRLMCIRQKLGLASRTQVAVYSLTGYRPDAAARERELYERHGWLVDQKFLGQITNQELTELNQLRGELDKLEEGYYAPIFRKLEHYMAALEGAAAKGE